MGEFAARVPNPGIELDEVLDAVANAAGKSVCSYVELHRLQRVAFMQSFDPKLYPPDIKRAHRSQGVEDYRVDKSAEPGLEFERFDAIVGAVSRAIHCEILPYEETIEALRQNEEKHG